MTPAGFEKWWAVVKRTGDVGCVIDVYSDPVNDVLLYYVYFNPGGCWYSCSDVKPISPLEALALAAG